MIERGIPEYRSRDIGVLRGFNMLDLVVEATASVRACCARQSPLR